MKDKFGGEYSKFLTVLLIIAIILIVGLLGFLGYDMIKKYYITKETDKALNEFEQNIESIVQTNTTDVPMNLENNINIPTTNIMINTIETNTTIEQNTNSGSTSNSSSNTNKSYYTVGKIEIPKTDCKNPIYNKATKESIEKGVAILYSNATGLNQPGNIVIEGHNYRNGLFFSNNKKLENGDVIYITDESGNKVKYTIYNKYETTPEDASYFERDTGGKREIVLLTCTDDANRRLLIFASAD